MSSHHIVREKQEPALLVLGLDNFPEELLGQLLEWSPTIITTGQTAEKLIIKGIKIDCIIGNGLEGDLQANVKLLPAGKGTMVADALTYLVTQGFPAVNVVTDEFDLRDYEPFADKIDFVVFYHYKKIYPVKSGFSKWKQAGEIIELLTQPAGLRVSGLENINHGQYKTTHDGFFSLQFYTQFLLIAEEM